MPRLLVVHHTPSPATRALLEAAAVLGETNGRPFGFWVHGNDDTAGAIRAIAALTSGLGWAPVARGLSITGAPDKAALSAVQELASTVAVTLLQ